MGPHCQCQSFLPSYKHYIGLDMTYAINTTVLVGIILYITVFSILQKLFKVCHKILPAFILCPKLLGNFSD